MAGWCKEKNIVCENANDRGYCYWTACLEMLDFRFGSQKSNLDSIPVNWIEEKIKERIFNSFSRWNDVENSIDTMTLVKAWKMLVKEWAEENNAK